MSEFPKSFRWHADAMDVITFNSPDDRPFCKQGMRWDWSTMPLVISPSKWIPLADDSTELTLLRTFRDTVLNAAQETPNHQLPAAIFAADDLVRKVNQQQEPTT